MAHSNKKAIIILAYCNRFVFPLLAFFIPVFVGSNNSTRVLYLGISLFCLAAYHVIGVLLKWKHVYCALQSMAHRKMTPDNIQWDTVGFADKFGLSIVLILFSVALLFLFSSCAASAVKGSVVEKTTGGNAVLDIMPQKLMEKAEVGDTVVVTIGDFEKEMPFVDELILEDGKLQLLLDRDAWNLSVCIYNGNFCETYGIDVGEKVLVELKDN